jgi:hypothetical protein
VTPELLLALILGLPLALTPGLPLGLTPELPLDPQPYNPFVFGPGPKARVATHNVFRKCIMMLPTRNNHYKQKNPFQCPCSGYLKGFLTMHDFFSCQIITIIMHIQTSFVQQFVNFLWNEKIPSAHK